MSQTPHTDTRQDRPEQELVLSEQRGHVRILTLNRPDRLNAWNDALETRYFELLEDADADPTVRAIVITGAGRGFCSGADVADLRRASDAPDEIHYERARGRSFPMSIRKPMIAAINGATAGLGLVEALYCDLRFASTEAKLTTAFVRRGLIAEYGIAWLLPRLIGPSRALDLLLSGRTVLAEEALTIGLVDRIIEPAGLVDAAVEFATELATYSSPTSMAVIKAQVQRAMDTHLSAATAEADTLMIESFARADAREGVASYLERRTPDFAALSTPLSDASSP